MKRKAMLAAVLGLLVVGCQSEFDRCMEVGTPINEWMLVSTSPDGASEFTTMMAKVETWQVCAGRRK